jgi:hypothetical protein
MQIEIRAADGSFLRNCSLDLIEKNLAHFTVVRNRRGHIKAAILKPDLLPLVNLSKTGYSFQQTLPSGRVWALQGVIGSSGAA